MCRVLKVLGSVDLLTLQSLLGIAFELATMEIYTVGTHKLRQMLLHRPGALHPYLHKTICSLGVSVGLLQDYAQTVRKADLPKGAYGCVLVLSTMLTVLLGVGAHTINVFQASTRAAMEVRAPGELSCAAVGLLAHCPTAVEWTHMPGGLRPFQMRAAALLCGAVYSSG
jgi:hypothetical protein